MRGCKRRTKWRGETRRTGKRPTVPHSSTMPKSHVKASPSASRASARSQPAWHSTGYAEARGRRSGLGSGAYMAHELPDAGTHNAGSRYPECPMVAACGQRLPLPECERPRRKGHGGCHPAPGGGCRRRGPRRGTARLSHREDHDAEGLAGRHGHQPTRPVRQDGPGRTLEL